MKRFITIWVLVYAGINIWLMDRIRILEAQKPLIVYHADNQGSGIKGIVSEKKKIGSLYTITINDNVFVINEQKYRKIKIGDEVEL